LDGFYRFGLKTCCNGFRWFGLKISGDGFLQFGLKTGGDVSPGLGSKPVVSFLVEPQNQDSGGFLGLDLKTDSSDLLIYASKSPRRFLVLWLKTKWV
jgi:hypothetical protein